MNLSLALFNVDGQIPCDSDTFEGENIEPISMAFMLVFGLLLVLQFVGMLCHRLATFLHIAAATELKSSSRVPKGRLSDIPDVPASDLSSGAVLEWVKAMQKVCRKVMTSLLLSRLSGLPPESLGGGGGGVGGVGGGGGEVGETRQSVTHFKRTCLLMHLIPP